MNFISHSLICAFAVTLFAVDVKAASTDTKVRIAPSSANIDAPSDTINDIFLRNGELITFSIFFDNSANTVSTTDVDYIFYYDKDELEIVSCVSDVSMKFDFSLCENEDLLNSGKLLGSAFLDVGLIDKKQKFLAPQTEFELSRWVFKGKDVNPWPGDGEQDAYVEGSNKSTNRENPPPLVFTDISSFKSNNLEVQQPVPVPLPIIGLISAFSSIRRLNALSKRMNQGFSSDQ